MPHKLPATVSINENIGEAKIEQAGVSLVGSLILVEGDD
jgi:hypothetical protein